MEPISPLSQLAMCCGLGRRQRGGFQQQQAPLRNYYYSPSMAQLGGHFGNTWPIPAAMQAPPAQQPYLLLTQPVIITGNPNQGADAMTLVQHATTAAATSPFHQQAIINQQRQTAAIVSSPFPIYNNAAVGTGLFSTNAVGQPESVLTTDVASRGHLSLVRNRSSFFVDKQNQFAPTALPRLPTSNLLYRPIRQPAAALNKEIFRKLELLEKQVDLSKDMELVEQHGIVITRAIDPDSLYPYVNEVILKRYESQFSLCDDHVIQFIEIIKRPGQTLGLYIRTVQFENLQLKFSRLGIVITKIESDSPVYNSRVIHVGDEVLSINLVDVQGMSMDDVVVLMSIPKRLVLALRVSRERAQTIRQDMIKQHNQQELTTIAEKRDATQVVQGGDQRNTQQELQSNRLQQFLNASQGTRGGQVGGGSPFDGGLITSQASSIKREPDLHHAVPARIHSSYQVRDVLNEKVPQNEFLLGRGQYGQDQSSPSGCSPHVAQGQSLGVGYLEARRVMSSPFAPVPTSSSSQQQRQYNPRQLNQLEIRLDELSEPMVDNTCDDQDDESFRNYTVDRELAMLEREAMNKDRPVTVTELGSGNRAAAYLGTGGGDGHNNDSLNSAAAPYQHQQAPDRTSSRRLSSSGGQFDPNETTTTTSPIKQPIIDSIRLGTTPEQSSYFSSSIEAINRELKELRRQRVALSNDEPPGPEQPGRTNY